MRIPLPLRVVFAVALLAFAAPPAPAQETVLTLDYYGTPPPAYPWTFEINPGISAAIENGNWKDYYLSATASWQPHAWVRFDGIGEFHATYDPNFVNSTEIRPMILGAAIWPTQGEFLNLLNPEFNIRLDYRFISYERNVEDVLKSRARFQLLGRFTVNDSVMSIGTWYIPWAVETYTDLDGDPKERYAYMWRWRVGVGYVVSGFLRTELHYIASRTRNTTADPFELSTRTIWFVIRNYY